MFPQQLWMGLTLLFKLTVTGHAYWFKLTVTGNAYWFLFRCACVCVWVWVCVYVLCCCWWWWWWCVFSACLTIAHTHTHTHHPPHTHTGEGGFTQVWISLFWLFDSLLCNGLCSRLYIKKEEGIIKSCVDINMLPANVILIATLYYIFCVSYFDLGFLSKKLVQQYFSNKYIA